MTATIECVKCATDNPATARFCMSCGSSLEQPCPSCETELPPAARFCFNCGHEIESGAAAADGGATAREVTNSIAEKLRALTAGAGERRTITMMFCDVADSTATAEQLDPEAWSDIMREAMGNFVTSVEQYGGTVARLLGDAILAYFGAPIAHEDDPQRALLAALAIQSRSRELCDRVRAAHGTNFNVRIGINTGLVVVGGVGSATFGEYAALGDAANVAARMEQTAELGTIRIAEPTYRLVAPLFETVAVGAIAVKGRTEPVATYEVTAAIGMPGQVRGIDGLTSDMVGRDAELATLLELMAAVAGGSGRIASIMAEAGLGKSRLAAELRANVDRADVHWMTGQCHSYQDTVPYGPFVPALQACLEIDLSLDHARQSAQVFERVVGLLGDEARDLGRYLCSLLGLPLLPDDENALAFMDPGSLRQRVFDAVAAIIVGIAAHRPLVLELEDLHWADQTSIELIEHLLPLVDSNPVLLLLLFRPRRDEPSWHIHEVASREFSHRYRGIELEPLNDDESRELVANLLRVEGLAPHVRSAILAKSEGNPFFVEEVIRSLLDSGVVRREGERFVATAAIDDIAVPDTLAAVLATRLDQLSPQARHVVQTAAVLGRDFSPELLRLLVDADIDLDEVLTDLQRRQLVVEKTNHPDVVLTFNHAMTRDTAYNTLLLSVRKDLHRIVGKLVEERHPDWVFDLARHFAECDDARKAVPYLVAAGQQAFGAFARDDAARYFRRALALWSDDQDVGLARGAYEGLANALMFLGMMPEAIATLEEMLAFAREQGDVVGEVSALNKSGMVTLLATGDADRAEAHLLAAKALAESEGDRQGVAEFHVGYCFLNTSKGRLDQAEKHLGEAAEVCFTLDAHHRNFGLAHYATTLVYQARFDDARLAVDRARHQAELDRDLEHIVGVGYARVLIELFTGHPADAVEMAIQSAALAERIGSMAALSLAGWAAGLCLVQLGDFDRATPLLRAAVGAAQASGNTGPGAASLVALASIEQWLHGPDTETAADLRRQAMELSETPMAQAAAGAVYSGIALDRVRAGDFGDADKMLGLAVSTPSATSKLVQPEVLLCGAGVAMGRGDHSAATELIGEAATLVNDHGLDLYLPRTLLGQATVAQLRGDVDRMQSELAQAEDTALERRLALDTISIQRAAAAMLTAAGSDAAAAAVAGRLGDSVADVASGLADRAQRRDFLRTNSLVG